MPGVYLCNVTGDGTEANVYRPNLPAGVGYLCLMIHEAKAKALVISPADAITHPGVVTLISAPTRGELRTLATTTSPTAGQRTTINTWLTNNGYEANVTAGMTWAQVIHYVARQVNPAADLLTATVG